MTENYLSNAGSAGWRLEYSRTTIDVSAQWGRDTCARLTAPDVTRSAFGANLQRRISPMLSLQVLGSIGESHYFNADYDARDSLIGAGLTLQGGERTEFTVRYDHLAQSASGIGTDYYENRVFLTIRYPVF
jgi:hypothetical protein